MPKATDLGKDRLLEYLCGTVCPGCAAPKGLYQWTCGDCYLQFGRTPQHDALNDLCDEHMNAAANYLAYVRASRAA